MLGTGPSLKDQRESILRRRESDEIRIYGVNNTFNDFPLDVWIACDPTWHAEYGPITGDFDKYHWDKTITDRHDYTYIEGRWADGLSTDQSYIHYGHSSGYQALGLAALHGFQDIYLAGYDMHYDGESRHYFNNLSENDGEYPEKLRKYSAFEGLISCYETIAKQETRPNIYNMTHDSALTCFPFKSLG